MSYVSRIMGLDELEDENFKLQKKIKDQTLILQGIYQTTNDYLKRNSCVSHVGFTKIKDMAILGLDIASSKD